MPALFHAALGSDRSATLIFLNVPLALSEGLLALAVRGYPFSISAAIGFIALFGIAALNAVVLLATKADLHRELGESWALLHRVGGFPETPPIDLDG